MCVKIQNDGIAVCANFSKIQVASSFFSILEIMSVYCVVYYIVSDCLHVYLYIKNQICVYFMNIIIPEMVYPNILFYNLLQDIIRSISADRKT